MLGAGEGGARGARERVVSVFIKSPRGVGGGGFPRRGGGPGGAGRVSAGNFAGWGGGGGQNNFNRAEIPTKIIFLKILEV